MKKLFLTTVLIALFVGRLFAQAPMRSTLKIRLSDGAPLSVIITGRDYNRQGTQLTFGDLPAGMHRLRVFRVGRMEGRRRSQSTLVYEGTVRLRPETFNLATVDVNNGSFNIRTSRLGRDRDDAGNRIGDGRNDVHNYDRNDDVYGGDDRDRNRDDRSNNNYGNDRTRELTERDIVDIRTRVAQRITDTDKESLMKTALDGRTFSTAQVVTLMRMLSFESTKLDFAKWAYRNVTDRKNYWKLESEFSFSSSKEEFNNYIRAGR